MQYKKELSVAVTAAKAAGKIMMENYSSPRISFKADKSTLTNVDMQCEKAIKSIIKRDFPRHAFLGEETGHDKKGSGMMWVVDPLDGTTNYAMKNPFFCTSICLMDNNNPVVGVVCNPFTKELFSAVHGKGAFMNSKKLHVSGKSDIATSVVGFCYGAGEETRKRVSLLFGELTKKTNKLRQFGAAALELSYVAAGRIDAFFMISANAWDVAAGCLLVSEAGGIVTDFTGAEWDMDKKDVLAGNGNLHEELLGIIRKP